MARQKVRFNYFVPKLEGMDGPITWDMKEFLDYIINNRKSFRSYSVIGDEISDLEWSHCSYDLQNNLYYIQLSKLRSKNIPARKRISQDSTPIALNDDEYLGEFNLLIYDPILRILAIQGNFYGLTTKQIQQTLSNLRINYKAKIKQEDPELPLLVNLEPIIDNQQINKITRHNKIYRQVVIKGSDYKQLANTNLSSQTIDRAVNAVGKIDGVNFKIEISMARTPKGQTLDVAETKRMINDVLDINREIPGSVAMNISTKKDEDSAVEHINVLTPTLTSYIVLEIEARRTIGVDFMYRQFLEQNYLIPTDSMRNKVIHIIPH